jgi:hypothetical protein
VRKIQQPRPFLASSVTVSQLTRTSSTLQAFALLPIDATSCRWKISRKIGLFCDGRLLHSVTMKRHLTAKQISSVPCPTCGVAPGMRCERYSGALRRQPHIDRRFVATEVLVQEAETVHAGPSRRKSKRSSK